MSDPPRSDDTADLALGHAALLTGDWSRARDCFEAALRQGDTPEARDGLGLALWWLNEIAASHEQRMLAYTGYRKRGDAARAAVIAAWLAREQVFFRSNTNAMSGWFARGERLLRAIAPCVETSWFALLRASLLAPAAELERIAADAIAEGETYGDGDLEAMARAFYGLARISLGHVHDGMDALDEAMAQTVGGEVASYSTVSEVYCVLLSACELAGDMVRLENWLGAASAFARRQGSAFLSAYCRTTYGGLLTATGRWDEAEAELLTAIHVFESGHAGLRIHAVVKLAELRIAQGRLEEAERLLAGYEDRGEAALPLARLHLVRHNAALARALIAQHAPSDATAELGQIPWLLLSVEVSLTLSEIARARDSVERLALLARESGSDLLLAQAALTQARVKRAAGEPDARDCLLTAMGHLRAYGEAFVTGRVRFELARDLAETDWPAAVTWARAALATFERIGAAHDADAARRLLRQLGVGPRPGPRGVAPLTEREGEVLALMTAGLTNREIAGRLVITPKTAEHHVSQILHKLGARNRAEAVTLARVEGLC